MFGITKSEGYYFVQVGKSSTKVGYKTYREALIVVITGVF